MSLSGLAGDHPNAEGFLSEMKDVESVATQLLVVVFSTGGNICPQEEINLLTHVLLVLTFGVRWFI